MNTSSLPPYQIAMLIGGVILFLLAVGLIVFLAVKHRSTKPGIAILPLAILMIGFPGIKNFKGLGFELENAVQMAEAKARALEEDPDNPAVKRELETALTELESHVTTNSASAETAETIAQGHAALGHPDRAIQWASVAVKKAPQSETARIIIDRATIEKALPSESTTPLAPAVRSNLFSAATELSRRRHLTPATRMTLAKAQLALGQTNNAATNLQRALIANTNLTVNPRLKLLLNNRPTR